MKVTGRKGRADAYFPYVVEVREVTHADRKILKKWCKENIKLNDAERWAKYMRYSNFMMQMSKHQDYSKKILRLYFTEGESFAWFMQRWGT